MADLPNVNNSTNIKSNLNIFNLRRRRSRSNLQNRERHDDGLKHRNLDQAKSSWALIAKANMPQQPKHLRSRTTNRECRGSASRFNSNSKTSRRNSELKNYHERQSVASRFQQSIRQSRKAQTPSKISDSSDSASGSPLEASGPNNFERKTHLTHSKSRGAASSQLSASGLKIFTSSARNEVQVTAGDAQVDRVNAKLIVNNPDHENVNQIHPPKLPDLEIS